MITYQESPLGRVPLGTPLSIRLNTVLTPYGLLQLSQVLLCEQREKTLSSGQILPNLHLPTGLREWTVAVRDKDERGPSPKSGGCWLHDEVTKKKV